MLNIIDNNSTIKIEEKDLTKLPDVDFDLSIIDVIKGYKEQASNLFSYIENIIKSTDYNNIEAQYNNGNYTYQVTKSTIPEGEYSA